MKKSYLKYICALLLFGSNGVVAGHIHLDSSKIVLLRTLIGSIFLVILFFAGRQRLTFRTHKKDFAFLLLSGPAMGASWMFLYEAYARLGIGIASLLYYTGPVIVLLLSPVFFRERLTALRIIGFAAVFAGVVLMNLNLLGNGAHLFGIFCGLMSALTYSVMVMANKKAAHITGMENSMIQLVVSFLTVAVFVVFRTGYRFQISPPDWGWILVLGVLNTGIGCYLYFSSIGNLPVQTVSVCGYLEPLSAVLFSVTLAHETLLPLQIAGAVLMLGGAVLSEHRTLFQKAT